MFLAVLQRSCDFQHFELDKRPACTLSPNSQLKASLALGDDVSV